MADDLAALTIAVNFSDVEAASRALESMPAAASRAEGAVRGIGTASASTGRELGLLRTAAASLFGALSVGLLFQVADGFSDMSSQVNLAAGSVEKGSAVMDRLNQIAFNTYSSLSQTAKAFTDNSASMRDLGYSTQQVLDYTSALNSALVVSGAKAERAAQVQNALSKAMSLGKLSGENLNTVIQNGGEVAALLAARFNTTTGGLLKLGQQGKITSKVISDTLIGNLGKLEEKAASMPATMQDAATGWANAITIIIGAVDQATGASGGLAQSLYDMSKTVADQAATIAQAFIVMKELAGGAIDAIGKALSGTFGDFDSQSALLIAGAGAASAAFINLASVVSGVVVASFRGLFALLLSNPLTLIVAGIGAAIAALYIFRDEISQILGVDFIGEAKKSANQVIGVFVGAYNIIVEHWRNLPAVFNIVGKQAWNKFIEAFEGESLWIEAFGDRFTLFDGLDLSKFKATIAEDQKEIAANTSKIMGDALSTNYVDNMANGLKTVWDNAGGAAKRIADIQKLLANDNKKSLFSPDEDKNAAKLRKAYEDLLRTAQDRVAQMELEAQLVGKNAIEAEVLRMKLEALQQAEQKGLKLKPEQIAQLDALAEKYGEVARKVAELQLMEEATFDREQMFRSPIDQRIASDLKQAGIEMDSVAGQAYASYVRTTEQIGIAKDAARDFAGTFVSDLLAGKSALEALTNALGRLADKLLQMALDQAINSLFSNLLGVTGGAGGGLFGGLFGGSAPFANSGQLANGFASGGLGLYASGGISNKPAIFGEAGPEAAVPLPDGRSIPVTLFGAANSNQPSGSNVSRTVVELRMSPDVEARILSQSAEQSVQIVQSNQKARDDIYMAGGMPR